MRVCLAVHPWSHAGDAAESTRKMCRVTVAQQMRDIGHAPVEVLEHPFRGIEPYLIPHIGVARALRREFTLQTAFAHITQSCSELYVQILFLSRH